MRLIKWNSLNPMKSCPLPDVHQPFVNLEPSFKRVLCYVQASKQRLERALRNVSGLLCTSVALQNARLQLRVQKVTSETSDVCDFAEVATD